MPVDNLYMFFSLWMSQFNRFGYQDFALVACTTLRDNSQGTTIIADYRIAVYKMKAWNN